ncbi:hypothetical protein [Magnetospirillum aberrantis]|uniref:Uncharacterized protein n=1 Tax=Magnetospirillum aberrantis SpK TaxID=908842 RepID=A0A7C9QWW5_9PROT|nr:hypothetical protein [Magnetospirillum aberrantis]NFV82121.1 hypothetical protein [Magnetospirillum aberrantis SpK]
MNAVAQAIGRSITQREAENVEARILDSMRQLARKDPTTWRQLGRDERLRQAGAEAGKALLHEAAKRKQRVALTILAHDKVMNRYSTLVSEGLKPFQAIARVLDDANRFAKGVGNEYFSGLIDTLNAVHPKFLGMVENSREAAALVREIFGEHTGSPLAAKGAKAWLDTVEAMRQRFNAAGGDVGKLDYGYLPQPHDDLRVLKAGQAKWVSDTLPLLDRSRYIDENGVLLNDAQMVALLNQAWETLSTGGLNKLQPGQPGGNGMRANRGNEQRVIHFKDAASYLTYAASYNRGGILSAMQGHVSRLAKDIALVEEFGPNPQTQWGFLHDTARKTGQSDLVGPWLVSTQNMWDVLNGSTGLVANVRLAEIAQGVRNIEVFGKLGSAFISSVTDLPTYFATTGFNRLGVGNSLVNLIRSFGKESADYANRAGLVADSIVSDMNRWAEGNIGKGWTGKLANATMKASLLEAWTNAIRRGFSVTMMGAMGKLSRLDWSALEAGDRARLERLGVTERDFAVWRLATPEKWRGSDMLTLQALRGISEADLQAAGLSLRDQSRAVSKLLGAIVDESEFASLAQDLQTRAAVIRGTQKGTIEGEFLRSIMLFKGFPMAMISRHWGRVADQWRVGEKASAVAYGVGLTTALTIFGGLALELKDLVNGKDPRDMTSAKFWGAAFAQGGGVGIFGDFLYTGMGGQNRAGVPNWMNLFGPVVGSGLEAVDLTVGNIGQGIRGEKTHAGAEAVRFARSHLPFVNLWYAKAALDHAGLQDIQEIMSPGYLSRMRQRAHQDWGQDYWWRPGSTLPDRAPDLSAATGR